MSVTGEGDRRRDGRPAAQFVLGLTVYLTCLLCSGYRDWVWNHALQIPRVQVLQDPTLYPGDPLVAALRDYSSSLWPLVARLAEAFPLGGVLFALYLVEKALLVFAGWYLGRAMFPQRRLAPWAVSLLLALGIKPLLGAGMVTANYMEQTQFSVIFFILAMGAALRGRPFVWALAFAAGVHLNIMYGAHVLLYFAAWALLALRHRPAISRRWLAAIALFALLVLPTAYASLASKVGAQFSREDWLTVAMTLTPYHFLPLWWPRGTILLYLFGTAVVVALCWLGWRRHTAGIPVPTFEMVLGGTVAALAWFALAFLAAYVIREPCLLALHPLRGMDVWYALAGSFIIGYLAWALEEQTANRDLAYLCYAALAALLCLRLPYGPFMLLVLAILIVMPVWVWRRLLPVTKPTTIAALLCGGALLAVAAHRADQFRCGTSDLYVTGRTPELVEVAEWIQGHSAQDEGVLVFPWEPMPIFRPLVRRPVFVTWRDGSAVPFHPPYATTFLERMAALGTDLRTVPDIRYASDTDLKRLRDDDLLAICRRHHLRYIVLCAHRSSALPEVYRNAAYKVLEPRP